jgi:hypothetical protein
MKKLSTLGKKRHAGWQESFLNLLPIIQRSLRYQFRFLRTYAREEAMQNALAISAIAYARLYAQGRAHVANAYSLARYSGRQHRSGRIAGGHLNAKDAVSRCAAVSRGLKVMRLHGLDPQNCSWIDAILEDKRASIPDVVATKLDMRAWLRTLPIRTRRIARDLAQGCCTAEAAQKHSLSPGRISQLRRELEHSWSSFQGEVVCN